VIATVLVSGLFDDPITQQWFCLQRNRNLVAVPGLVVQDVRGATEDEIYELDRVRVLWVAIGLSMIGVDERYSVALEYQFLVVTPKSPDGVPWEILVVFFWPIVMIDIFHDDLVVLAKVPFE